MRNNTNLEEAKRLLGAGLNPDTADMVICTFVLDGGENQVPIAKEYAREPFLGNGLIEDSVPSWSLAALLELLPDDVHVNGKLYSLTTMHDICCIGYFPFKAECGDDNRISFNVSEPVFSSHFDPTPSNPGEMVRAVVDIVQWALETGKIDGGGEVPCGEFEKGGEL